MQKLIKVALGMFVGPMLVLFVLLMAWMLDMELGEGVKDMVLFVGTFASGAAMLAIGSYLMTSYER